MLCYESRKTLFSQRDANRKFSFSENSLSDKRKGKHMKVTPEILAAIDNAIDHYGNITQFAKHLGIAHSTNLFWKNGKTGNISGQLWINKLRHELKPFMHGNPYDRPRYMLREESAPYAVEQPAKVNKAPLATFSQIADFDPTIESPFTYATNLGGKSVLFARDVKPGYFALELDETAKCGDFPAGSVLLVASGEYAQNGDTVVAKLRDTNKIVIRHYSREDNQVKLSSVNGNGKTYEWDAKENSSYIVWMYPVIEINLDLASYRWVGDRLIAK